MTPIIEVNHLAKSYGKIEAVKDISFQVQPGKLFAFLGPNGAGKSTVINMICTFLKLDAGYVSVNGHTLGEADDAIRKSIGVVFQESLLDDLLTVRENLELRGSFYGISKANLDDAINKVTKAAEIEAFINQYYGKLSGGQRRRADIARALLHTPKILFLDEPTTGLDPQTRKNVWDTIKKLQREQGMTVFLTTHYMEEAEEADYCMIIDHGEIVAEGTPFALKETYAQNRMVLKVKEEQVSYKGAQASYKEEQVSYIEGIRKVLQEMHISYQQKDNLFYIHIGETMNGLPLLNKVADYIEDFTVSKGSMDDVFLNITGREIRE